MRGLILRVLRYLVALLSPPDALPGEVDSPPACGARPVPHAPRARGGGHCGRDDEDFAGVKVLDVVEFNALVEPQAVVLWCSMIRERGPLRVSVLCVEAAFRFDVSTETAKRWLLKHSAESAEFLIERGLVRLRER